MREKTSNRLYDDEQFFEELMAAYREIIPYVQALLDDQIDEYVNLISHSVAMDSVLMAEYSWVLPYHNPTTDQLLEYCFEDQSGKKCLST